jgi:hypothetical protein
VTDRAAPTTAPPHSRTTRSGTLPAATAASKGRHPVRTPRGDLAALPAAVHSEYIKLRSLRSNTAIAVLTGLLGLSLTWATAALVADEVIVSEDVLVLSDVFIYSTFLTAVIAAITSILTITSESQYGTLATALTAQPARWVIVAAKTSMAVAIGLVLGAISMITGAAGAALGGLEAGDTGSIPATAAWALTFTAIASVLGLGVGMTVRHSAAAISGFIIWWLVIENLMAALLPETVARFMPFYAGVAVLGVEVYKTTAETVAVALSRAESVLVFGGYAAVAVIAGTVLLYRIDTS